MPMSGITFDQWLRAQRAIRRMTQREAAEAVGVSPGTWLKWEGGALPVKLSDVQALADWAGVQRADVYEIVDRGPEAAA